MPQRSADSARAALVASAALAALAAPAAACPLAPGAGRAIDGDGVRAAWTVADAVAIEVGAHFSLQVRACPAEVRLTRVDAHMPAHRHGMNYRPTVTPAGPGAWRVDGLMFHMRGRWELVLEFERDRRRQVLRTAVELP